MTAPRRGRPPKPPDEVRTVRVTVLLNDREHATLLRACGGRGVASLLREAGLREAAAMAAPLRALPLHPSVHTRARRETKAAGVPVTMVKR